MRRSVEQVSKEPTSGKLVAAGILGGLSGFIAGGLIGARLAGDCSHDFCDLEGAFFGAAAGGTLGMATGIHLANQRRGNLPLDFLTGAAIWGAGIVLVAATESEPVTWAAFFLIPGAQLAATVAVERATARSRAQQ